MGLEWTTIRELVGILRANYCGNVGLEYMHISDVEERRFPGRGKRRRRRSSERDFQIEDQRLLQIVASQTFATTSDLKRLLPKRMPKQFHTAHLAERLKTPRWTAHDAARFGTKMPDYVPKVVQERAYSSPIWYNP